MGKNKIDGKYGRQPKKAFNTKCTNDISQFFRRLTFIIVNFVTQNIFQVDITIDFLKRQLGISNSKNYVRSAHFQHSQ